MFNPVVTWSAHVMSQGMRLRCEIPNSDDNIETRDRRQCDVVDSLRDTEQRHSEGKKMRSQKSLPDNLPG